MRFNRAGPDAYLTCMRGGGMPVYAGAPYQRGHGLGGIFRGLAKMAMPLVKRAAPVLFKTAKKVVRAKMKGTPMKQILRDQGTDLAGQMLTNMMGKKRRGTQQYKRKKPQRAVRSKRLKAGDIFS